MNVASTSREEQIGGRNLFFSLSGMMFLQYAVWGVWLPYLARYLQTPESGGGLGFSGSQIGWILGIAASLGAIGAPFIAGQVADRIMNAERALAALLLVGGGVNMALSQTSDYSTFMLLSIVYSICYMPTLSLTNSIVFQNVPDSQKQFPAIRVFGTVGWIVASNFFPILWLTSNDPKVNIARYGDSLLVAGVLSIAYAVYAMIALPRTPPRKDATRKLAVAQAFRLLLRRDVAVLTIGALLIAMIHQVYFFRMSSYLGDAVGFTDQWIGPVMSIGQFSEIAFLAVLGLFLKRIGFKAVLMMGCAAYAIRFGIFATLPSQPTVIAGQILHGLCYGCLFAGAFVYIEHVAPKDIRHSAQTVFGIVILGLGPILAGFYNNIFASFEKTTVVDGVARTTQAYDVVWFTQAGIAAAVFLLFLVAFPARPTDPREAV